MNNFDSTSYGMVAQCQKKEIIDFFSTNQKRDGDNPKEISTVDKWMSLACANVQCENFRRDPPPAASHQLTIS